MTQVTITTLENMRFKKKLSKEEELRQMKELKKGAVEKQWFSPETDKVSKNRKKKKKTDQSITKNTKPKGRLIKKKRKTSNSRRKSEGEKMEEAFCDTFVSERDK